MWPLVEVTTTGAVWGYFAILWLILIGGPCLLTAIAYKFWVKPLYERKFKEVDLGLYYEGDNENFSSANNISPNQNPNVKL